MHQKKQFLILTSDSGFGHRSSANAIAKALNLSHPGDAETHVVNPILDLPAPSFLQKAELNYDEQVTKYRDWWQFFYEISDSRMVSSLVEGTLTLALQDNIKQLVDRLAPDAIVSTNEMFNGPLGAVLAESAQPIPFFTVITDLADVHALWFSPEPDHYFVASEFVKTKALENGIAEKDITISGVPVDPDFKPTPGERTDLRLKCGLDPELTTLLVVGSQRISSMVAKLKALDTCPHPFQVAAIAGGDDKLYENLKAQQWSFPITIQNYVKNMPEWMRAADVLISKAGGMIISEGLAAGLPMILIDFLPGQEEGNVDYVTRQDAGAFTPTPAEFASLVNTWLQNDLAQLKSRAAKAQRLGRPEACFTIAEDLWQAAAIPKAKQTSPPGPISAPTARPEIG